VALHCAHIFKGGEAPAGISMVGILFLLALRYGLPVFCNSVFSVQSKPNGIFVFNGHGSSVRDMIRHLVYRCTGEYLNPDLRPSVPPQTIIGALW
jgi:hypothetical protein